MLRLLSAAALAALLLAAPAGAATIPVAPGESVQAAVAAARDTPEADTIALGAGRYAEAIVLDDPVDAGLTLRGAGDGATVLAAPDGALAVLEIGADADGVRVRDLRIEHPGTTIAGERRGRAAVIHGDDVTLEAVSASAVSDSGQDHTLLTYGERFAAHRLHTYAQGWSAGLIADKAVTITDSTHEGGYGGWESFGAGHSTFARVRVTLAPDAGTGIGTEGPVTIDSALVLGGRQGVQVRTGSTDAPGLEALLRNVTVDAGARLTADPIPGLEEEGSLAVEFEGGQMLVESSVLLDGVEAWFDDEVRCEYSATRGQVDGGDEEHGLIACPADAQGNLPAVPALLTDGHALAPGSPARDAGRPGALVEGQTATDAAGAPRIAVPAGGCDPGRVDMGAFEAAAPACAPGCAATASCPPPAGCQADASCPPATCTAAAPPCTPPATCAASSAGRTASSSAGRTASSSATGRAMSSCGPAADRSAPRLRGLALARRGRAARLRGTVSEAARLRVTVQRCGGRQGCKRPRAVRRATAQVAAGRFSLPLSLRGLRHRRHRVLVTAVDAAGNAGASRSLTLTIR